LIEEYLERRKVQPRGKLPVPRALHKARKTEMGGNRSHPWGPGTAGYDEYLQYEKNINRKHE